MIAATSEHAWIVFVVLAAVVWFAPLVISLLALSGQEELRDRVELLERKAREKE